ncbi:hypothetical protein GF420_03940 [candidate division GN15 bacterium]|nr:hypothetical protein [candidate division GN15 bacterium]
MIRDITSLCGCKIIAKDGLLGKVAELLIDDKHWRVRFIVVEVSHWQPGHRVLLPMTALGDISWDNQVVRVPMTRDALIERWIGAVAQ